MRGRQVVADVVETLRFRDTLDRLLEGATGGLADYTDTTAGWTTAKTALAVAFLLLICLQVLFPPSAAAAVEPLQGEAE